MAKMPEIVNLTPHKLDIELVDGSFLQIPPSGKIARHSSTVASRIFRIGKIPIDRVVFGDVIGLPGPKPNTIYVVSLIVLQELQGTRMDVYAPGELIRDQWGRTIGCRGLKQI